MARKKTAPKMDEELMDAGMTTEERIENGQIEMTRVRQALAAALPKMGKAAYDFMVAGCTDDVRGIARIMIRVADIGDAVAHLSGEME